MLMILCLQIIQAMILDGPWLKNKTLLSIQKGMLKNKELKGLKVFE